MEDLSASSEAFSASERFSSPPLNPRAGAWSAESTVSMPHGNRAPPPKDGNASILGQARNLLLISQLLDMGFDVKASEEALQATGGSSAEKAADWLLVQKATGGAKSVGHEPTKQTTVNQFFPPPQARRATSADPDDRHGTRGGGSLWARRGGDSEGGRPTKLQRLEPPPGKLPPLEALAPLPPKKQAKFTPLAERMRPQTLDDIVGQDHLIGLGTMLRSLIVSNAVPSMIFWGPPGSGKTTLARVIAKQVSSRFVQLSAVTAGVKDVREVLEQARNGRKLGQRTLLFVDETHRFNKSQQDAFLPAVEAGDVTLIGATTENPSFELNSALLSRCRVFTLNKLQPPHIKQVLLRALSDEARGLRFPKSPKTAVGGAGFRTEDGVLDFLAGAADGDARTALNALEMAAGAALERAQRGGEQGAGGGAPLGGGLGEGLPASPSGRGGGSPLQKIAASGTEGAFGSPVEGTPITWPAWDAERDVLAGVASMSPRRKSSLGGEESPRKAGGGSQTQLRGGARC